jgi:cytochrome P450
MFIEPGNNMSYNDELNGAGLHTANAMLFAWLCDDEQRPRLYAELRKQQPVLKVLSRVKKKVDENTQVDQSVYLLTRKDDIDRALDTFSSEPYKRIGSGTFSLALDNHGGGHEEKRAFLMESFKFRTEELHQLATFACHHALVGPCKNDKFDLVTDIAEQAALRFVAALIGIPDTDHLLLQETMRRTYEGMVVQMFARHFVTEPFMLEAGNIAMGKMARRVAELMAESDIAGPTASLTVILQADAASAGALLGAMAQHAGKLHQGIREKADEFRKQVDVPGRARRTVKFLDQALNYAALRQELAAFVLKCQHGSTELRRELAAFIDSIVARKEAPEERLVPRRFVVKNGKLEVPRLDEALGDLCFRQTAIDKMLHNPGKNSGSDIVATVVGAIAGLMGNVIAGTCIAIEQFFKLPADVRENIQRRAKATTAFAAGDMDAAKQSAEALLPFIKEALRLQPPAAFIPRMTTSEVDMGGVKIPKGAEVLVPLGAATRDLPENKKPDAFIEERAPDAFKYVFGHPSENETSHRCVGEYVALPLIAHIVRSVLALPGLARQTVNGKTATLKKRWGYMCESFPLLYNRDRVLVQRPLNVVMRIKSPVAEHAQILQKVITSAAPSIEHLLRHSKMVHFARFVLLNNDTELALFTTYDAPFEEYIRHFARAAGPLFDKIFEHIEEHPPMPVRNHPDEFVEFIRRFDRPSVGGYFFSVNPGLKSMGVSP